MMLLTSRALSSSANSGLRTPAGPTRASTAVPPRAGVALATGWQAVTPRTAATPTAAFRSLLRMCRHPDERDRVDQECHHQDPCAPEDLALESSARPVAATPGVAPTADRAPKPGGLGRLNQDAGQQENGEHELQHFERVADLLHQSPTGIICSGPRSPSSSKC